MIAIAHYIHLFSLVYAYAINFSSPGYFNASPDYPDHIGWAFGYSIAIGLPLALNILFVFTDIIKASSWAESLFNHPKVISFNFGLDLVLLTIVFTGVSQTVHEVNRF